MKKTLFAPQLLPGDTIGIFSPSCPATSWIPERTELAIAFLESRGYPVLPGTLHGKSAGYRSGTIQERAEELNALIRNPQVRCIMASAGGYVSNAILPYIDYEALKKDPKVFVGFSDVTAVLLAVYAKTGLIPFLGPALIPIFGEKLPYSQTSFDSLQKIASGDMELPYTYPMPNLWTEDSVGLEEEEECTAAPNEWICVREGRVKGRLIGGNLDTLYGIWGSEYTPEVKEGDILYLEENRGNPEKMERALAHLMLCGVFDRIGGLILGKSADWRHGGTGMNCWQAAMEILQPYNFPILAEFDCAHTRPNLTLPLGCQYELDAGEKRLSLLEKPVW